MAARFRPLLVSLGLGVLGLLPVPASGALLASFTETSSGVAFFALSSSVDYDLCLSPSPTCQSPVLFDTLVVSAADAGSIFTATAATDPGFAAFAAALTNGSADFFIQRRADPPGSQSGLLTGRESIAFAGAGSASLNGIDLAGFTIDRIEFELGSDFTITQVPGSFLSYTALGGTLRFRVFGNPVPEPATALFVGGGMLLLGSRRRAAR